MSADHPPVIYCYSKSGYTRRAVDALARKTGAEIVTVEVNRYRFPGLWVCRAIWDVGKSRLPPLRTGNVVPVHRPWVVVAGPIWADQLAPPARSVLHALAQTDVPVGLLTTSGRHVESVKHVAPCENTLGRSLAARVNVPNQMDGSADMETRLSRFAQDLVPGTSTGAA